MTLTYYERKHFEVIKEAILLLDEYIFDFWKEKPKVEVTIDDDCDDDECILIVENVDQKHTLEAFNLCTAFVNGYLLAKGHSL